MVHSRTHPPPPRFAFCPAEPDRETGGRSPSLWGIRAACPRDAGRTFRSFSTTSAERPGRSNWKLAGILSARATGHGQVVDAAIVDGAANMLNLLLALRASGNLAIERGVSLIDGSHWSGTYRCADGRFVAVQSLEPRFYAVLLERLGLEGDPDFARQYDPGSWPRARQRLAELFATRPRDAWCALLEGTDACFAPVLDPEEAARHPHNVARGVFSTRDGMLQADPAPRFSRSPPPPHRPIPARGEHTIEVLRQAGIDETQLQGLIASGAVAQAR